MRRLPALVAALLLPASPPLLLGTAAFTGALLVSQAPAQAQSAEAVAKVAQAITVRIEGATQGSGVLVKRDGNRYTVLTAWHVVSGQRPGEELDIFVRDGTRQQLEQGSIKRLGDVDLAVLTFTSTNSYEIAQIGDIKSVSMGNPIWVSGFPLPSTAVPARLMRFIKGDVIANATVAIPDGYQLLYDNQTLPGVSGGAVLNAQGQLVGIHGKAEKADQVSESSGKAIATGTNQGVPISYYKQYAAGEAVVASSARAMSADDNLAQAESLLDKKGSAQEVIRLATQALAIKQSANAYFYRAYARYLLTENQGSFDDYTMALSFNPEMVLAYNNRAVSARALGRTDDALRDLDRAIKLSPLRAELYANRGYVKELDIDDPRAAINDFSRALSLSPANSNYYLMRASALQSVFEFGLACKDYEQAKRLLSGNQKALEELKSSLLEIYCRGK